MGITILATQRTIQFAMNNAGQFTGPVKEKTTEYFQQNVQTNLAVRAAGLVSIGCSTSPSDDSLSELPAAKNRDIFAFLGEANFQDGCARVGDKSEPARRCVSAYFNNGQNGGGRSCGAPGYFFAACGFTPSGR